MVLTVTYNILPVEQKNLHHLSSMRYTKITTIVGDKGISCTMGVFLVTTTIAFVPVDRDFSVNTDS